jgi:glutamate--cysteine ligase
MQGRLPGLPGEVATVGDFADHMTTVFTDVRLKRFLEMRGADAGSPAMMAAQSALWVGLLYDDAALAAASALVRCHDWTEFTALRPMVPRQGLSTPWQGGRLRDLARDVVAIAADGLRARGFGEAELLSPLEAIAEGEPTQADRWLDRYANEWAGDASLALVEAAV